MLTATSISRNNRERCASSAAALNRWGRVPTLMFKPLTILILVSRNLSWMARVRMSCSSFLVICLVRSTANIAASRWEIQRRCTMISSSRSPNT